MKTAQILRRLRWMVALGVCLVILETTWAYYSYGRHNWWSLPVSIAALAVAVWALRVNFRSWRFFRQKQKEWDTIMARVERNTNN